MGFSRQEYWSGFPFPSPVDHILSKHYHGPVAYSFVELDKAVIHSLLQDQFG